MLLIFLFFNSTSAQQQHRTPFSEWPIAHLDAGYIHCSEKKDVLFDDFKTIYNTTTGLNPDLWWSHLSCWPLTDSQGNYTYCLDSRIHVWSSEQIFMDKNISIDPTGEGKATIIAMNDNPVWTGSVPQVGTNPVDYTITREISSGVIKSQQAFTIAEYEIKCKMASNTNFWMAYWLAHDGEIDVFDIGKKGSFLNASYHKNDEHFTVIKQQDINNILSSLVDIDLSQNYHTYKARFTPFKIDFFIDDHIIPQSTVYKYYYNTGGTIPTPLDVDCGDYIISGNYKLNPVFPATKNSWFHPQVWLAVDLKCWLDNNVICNDDGDPTYSGGPFYIPENTTFPVSCEIDYIKISEQLFDFESLITDDCFILCPNEEVTIRLDSKRLNFQPHYPNLEYSENVQAWSASSNVQIIPPNNPPQNFVNIRYNGPININGVPEEQFTITAKVQGDEGTLFEITKTFYPPQEPEIITFENNCNLYVCVDKKNNCPNSVKYEFNNPNLEASGGLLEWADLGMECFLVPQYSEEDECIATKISYKTCLGERTVVKESCNKPYQILKKESASILNSKIEISCFDGEIVIFSVQNLLNYMENDLDLDLDYELSITNSYESYIINDITDNVSVSFEEWELPATYDLTIRLKCNNNVEKHLTGEITFDICKQRNDKKLNLSISPNPASNFISIELTKTGDGWTDSPNTLTKFLILDHNYIIIRQLLSMENESTFPLNGLAPGVYHIQAIREDHSTISSFIIQE